MDVSLVDGKEWKTDNPMYKWGSYGPLSPEVDGVMKGER
jgi:hypothetical protein